MVVGQKKKRKKKFTIEIDFDEKGQSKQKVELWHEDYQNSIIVNGKVETGKIIAPPGSGKSPWFLSNPKYYWQDSKGIWHCYCWGDSTC